MNAKKDRPAANGAAKNHHVAGGDSSAYLTALRKRRAATRRLTPLEHGPCDPWSDQPRLQLTPRSLIDTVLLLAPAGVIPLAPLDDFRAAWRAADTDAERAAIAHVVNTIGGAA